MTRNRWSAALLALGLALALATCGDEGGDAAMPDEETDTTQTASAGEALYEQHCLTCHQADGGGVPRFQPPLVGGQWVNGDPVTLAAFVISGGFDSASRKESANENVMPSYDTLSNEDLAALLTYVRTEFGDNAGPVTPQEVAQGRGMAAN